MTTPVNTHVLMAISIVGIYCFDRDCSCCVSASPPSLHASMLEQRVKHQIHGKDRFKFLLPTDLAS